MVFFLGISGFLGDVDRRDRGIRLGFDVAVIRPVLHQLRPLRHQTTPGIGRFGLVFQLMCQCVFADLAREVRAITRPVPEAAAAPVACDVGFDTLEAFQPCFSS